MFGSKARKIAWLEKVVAELQIGFDHAAKVNLAQLEELGNLRRALGSHASLQGEFASLQDELQKKEADLFAARERVVQLEEELKTERDEAQKNAQRVNGLDGPDYDPLGERSEA